MQLDLFCPIYESVGVVTYVPDNQSPGWAYLEVDQDLSHYYRWLSRIPWRSPLNGTHITFVAGQHEGRVVSKSEMNEWLGKPIMFYYSPLLHTNGSSWWLNVKSDGLDQIRRELGLLPRPSYHVTLGNLKENRK